MLASISATLRTDPMLTSGEQVVETPLLAAPITTPHMPTWLEEPHQPTPWLQPLPRKPKAPPQRHSASSSCLSRSFLCSPSPTSPDSTAFVATGAM